WALALYLPKSYAITDSCGARGVAACRRRGLGRSDLLGVATPTAVDQQHRDDNDAVDHVPAELLDLHDRQNRLEQRDEDHASDGAKVVTAAAQDRGPTQYHGGDRRQQVGVTHCLRRLASITGKQHTAERRQGSGDRERRNDDGVGP